MSGFCEILKDSPEFTSAVENVKSGKCPMHITGMSGSQKSHFIYSMCMALGKKCIVVTYDEQEAGRIRDDLSFLFCREANIFKNKDYVFYDIDASSHTAEISRLKTINAFLSGAPVVTTVEAVSKFTVSPDIFRENIIEITSSSTVDIATLSKKLVELGYQKSSTVEGMGQFSIRGSIIDIYSPAHQNPVRVDLFDNEVDSLREFDSQTQLSIQNTDSFTIIPVREIVYSEEKAKEVSQIIKRLKNENFLEDAEKLYHNSKFQSLDKYFPYFYDKPYSILDYADDDTLVFFDEAKQLNEKSKIIYEEHTETVTQLLEKGLFPRTKSKYMLDFYSVVSCVQNKPLVSLSSISHSCPMLSPQSLLSLNAKSLNTYTGKVEFLIDDIKYWKKNGYRISVVFSNEVKLKSLHEMLGESGIESSFTTLLNPVGDFGQVYLSVGNLSKGFEYPDVKTVVVSDGETKYTSVKKRLPKSNNKDVIKSFEDLEKGDYVVHRTHGVGKYVGITQLVVENVTKDYLKIKYGGSDILYVPTNQLDFLHKYRESEGTKVKLNTLGGSQWDKTVSRVKESVTALAEDLISLYAERSRIQGHVFSPDTPWQKEFEEKFIHEETADQLRCIEEVKSDMENGKCMDRLLCGDVGYGKTEIAIRAAFKCVMEGMQVAYLVPTTILAQQHYTTFSTRLEEYAMNVGMLSRFRTKKQQAKTIEGLKSGSVDVVIGTHRLLQKDIGFKNLGLVIVDEEQRFGVGHKEKLKELKKNVNVLTLSATPIPRTLNMAMVGIRDLSVLSEPPGDRYPVQTFVMEYNEAVIVNAIKREIERKGQVYYLYNRIDGIERVASRLKDLLGDVRIGVAHGKMSENQLEDIMMSLLDGEIDVLVCTTIIETGLDVSNVNTIIIENADTLGLSQLYQLRGRVGRSNRLAYAYLTYYPGKVLDNVSYRRLQAIREFTEFGSGFKIAMRDLEIRGAGNLLGKQQSGNMNLVGYDMYCMLLEQAVKEKKGEEYRPPLEISVDINEDSFIPSTYVEFEHQRIELYKKIASINSESDYYDIQAEFLDRFGNLPQSVMNLLDISYIKSLCRVCEIKELTQKGESVVFTFTDFANPDAVVKLISEYERDMKFTSGAKSQLTYRYKGKSIPNIKKILQKLANTIQDGQ